MKLRKQQLLRVVAFAMLIVLAAFSAAVINSGLSYIQAASEPLNSLPSMDVYYMGLEAGVRLPAEFIRLDKYDWRFMFWTRSGGGKDLEIWREIKEDGWIPPNTPIDFSFSFKPKSVRTFILAGELVEGVNEFEEIPSDNLIGPDVPGIYTIRVEANWGAGKDVAYYIKVQVPPW